MRVENSETSENAENPLFSEQDVVYIAGPMTGKPLFNYVQFFGIAGLIEKEYHCRILNPARQPNGLKYNEYLWRALRDVEKATAVLALDGWMTSKGAINEIHYASERNIRIVHEAELLADLSKRIFAVK